MLGLRPGGGREALERRGHLHGKTHIHMQEHVSTQSVPGPPAPAGTVAVEGEASLGAHAPLTCAAGRGTHASPGRGAAWEGAGFLAASQNPLCCPAAEGHCT